MKYGTQIGHKRNYIGSQISMVTKWTLPHLGDDVKFYLQNCRVHVGNEDIEIIKNGCFLEIFGSRLVSPTRIQPKEVAFTYYSFTTKESTSLTQLEKIQCDVKVCQTGRCVISSEADCAKIGLNKGLTYSTTGR